MIMKPQHFFLTLLMLVGVGCNPTPQAEKQANETATAKAEQKDLTNGIYYWKTIFELNETEREFLDEHHVERLYLRLFDIVPAEKNVKDEYGFDVVPNATITFRDSVPEQVEIVPVVYITIDALRQMVGSVDKYAELIADRVMNMVDFHDLGDIKEVQLDCDWTQQTQDGYFALCSAVREELSFYGIQLSCTIRLWQLSRACPPVNRGVLMLYNTGSITNPETTNSILDLNDVRAFLRGKKYDLPLDLAYPTYSWCVWFRNGTYMGLFHDLPIDDGTLFMNDSSTFYHVVSDYTTENRKLQVGDVVRYESVSYRELHELDSLVRLKQPSDNASIILYHLDSTNLSKFSTDEIHKVYCRN